MSTWSDSPTSEDMQKVLIICKGANHTKINPKLMSVIVLYLIDMYLLQLLHWRLFE